MEKEKLYTVTITLSVEGTSKGNALENYLDMIERRLFDSDSIEIEEEKQN